ncbi:hypothetical protein CTI12_AA327590 [Artemisia annua]|uniref:Uncharacterized protein n=1 Tax=Artemisia annua TaxID=35608 RepID=A0A2U1MYT7_ARTAN|nr:hypothetical protein CTI12_AA327590 [Artemisia annua]
MRTKSRVVRRHSIDQTFEGDVSVGADASVGSIASGDDLNGCSISSTVLQGSIDDGRRLVSDNGNWVGASAVPGDLGSFMEVDDGLQCVSVDVHTSVFRRPSSRITINEPHLSDATIRNTFHRSFMDVDVTWKGKGKVDDVPLPLHDARMGLEARGVTIILHLTDDLQHLMDVAQKSILVK